MGKIENVEVQSYTEHVTASYTDDDGQEYEIVFTRTYTENIGYEEKQLVQVEKDGQDISSGDPVWERIQEHVK